jgi:6-phosphogluconolactonase
MIEAEFWDYEDAGELAEAVAGDVAFIIESALDARGDALIALPGISTATAPVYERLAKAKLNWKKVTIIPTDERLVPLTDPLSNVGTLARHFLQLGARVYPVVSEAAKDYKAAGSAASARISDLKWPPDLVWLSVGEDGHVASICPGPDVDAAIEAGPTQRAIGLMPDPMPEDAPVARVTLTKSAILSARTLIVVGTGKKTRKVVEKAIEDGSKSRLPVGRVLAGCETPIDIHWLD